MVDTVAILAEFAAPPGDTTLDANSTTGTPVSGDFLIYLWLTHSSSIISPIITSCRSFRNITNPLYNVLP